MFWLWLFCFSFCWWNREGTAAGSGTGVLSMEFWLPRMEKYQPPGKGRRGRVYVGEIKALGLNNSILIQPQIWKQPVYHTSTVWRDNWGQISPFSSPTNDVELLVLAQIYLRPGSTPPGWTKSVQMVTCVASLVATLHGTWGRGRIQTFFWNFPRADATATLTVEGCHTV